MTEYVTVPREPVAWAFGWESGKPSFMAARPTVPDGWYCYPLYTHAEPVNQQLLDALRALVALFTPVARDATAANAIDNACAAIAAVEAQLAQPAETQYEPQLGDGPEFAGWEHRAGLQAALSALSKEKQ